MVGNPDLKQALIQNVDARWEIFPGQGEDLAAFSFFYKNFQNPIERIIEPTAQLRTSFTNANSARNIGIEAETRKAIGRNLLLGFNYTYIDSKIELDPVSRQVQTTLVRPLTGTSRNLFNVLLEIRNQNSSGRLLWNFHGDRISDVGSLGIPDIVQKGRNNLDFIFSRGLHEKADLKVSIMNLTDGEYVFAQGSEEQRIFSLGRTVSFGVTIRP